MQWINAVGIWLVNKFTANKISDQQKLVLTICLTSYIITSIALYYSHISTYLIAFVLILFALLCVYVLVANKVYADYKVRTLSNLIESMIDGDYSLRGRLQTDQANQELLSLINSLADTLGQHKLAAKQSRLLLERIMEQMDAMVLATDQQGYVVMANASANKILLANDQNTSNTQLKNTPLGAIIANAETGIVDFDQPQLKGEHFLSKERFLSDGKKHQLYILTNAERLLMEKERKAWQSLLRVLSHEMNNSLTPIASISQSMNKKLTKALNQQNRQSLIDGVAIINERAESLSSFIASYSQLSQLPKPTKSRFHLRSAILSIAPLFPEVTVCLAHCDDVVIEADKPQFEQVIINVFKNSADAMVDAIYKNITVSSYRDSKWLRITVSDEGHGIAKLDNVFVPFYTTKSQGSGIGLALCRQILFNHNGQITIENKACNNGVLVTLSLPL